MSGIPNNNNNDDYPASWTHKLFHTASTDNNDQSWCVHDMYHVMCHVMSCHVSCHVCRYAYSEAELADLTLRDVANTDWAVDQMKLIANDTHGMGKKPFFFTLGLHKVGEG